MVGGKALQPIVGALEVGTSWGWVFLMGISQSGTGTWKIKPTGGGLSFVSRHMLVFDVKTTLQ